MRVEKILDLVTAVLAGLMGFMCVLIALSSFAIVLASNNMAERVAYGFFGVFFSFLSLFLFLLSYYLLRVVR